MLKYFDTSDFTPNSLRDALMDKQCHALMAVQSDKDVLFSDKNFNADCRFGVAGEAFGTLFGGWPFSLRGPTCPHFIVAAFSEIIRTLSDEGIIQELYDKYLEGDATVSCNDGPSGATSDTSAALGLRQLAGVLLTHTVVVGLCLLGWLFPLRRQSRKRAAKQSNNAGMKATSSEVDHHIRENLDSLKQYIDETEGRIMKRIDLSISELECRLKAGTSPSEFCAGGVARIDAKNDSPLHGRMDDSERLMAQLLGRLQHQMDLYETKLDAKLDVGCVPGAAR